MWSLENGAREAISCTMNNPVLPLLLLGTPNVVALEKAMQPQIERIIGGARMYQVNAANYNIARLQVESVTLDGRCGNRESSIGKEANRLGPYVKTALIEGYNGKQGHFLVAHMVEAVGGKVAVRWLRSATRLALYHDPGSGLALVEIALLFQKLYQRFPRWGEAVQQPRWVLRAELIVPLFIQVIKDGLHKFRLLVRMLGRSLGSSLCIADGVRNKRLEWLSGHVYCSAVDTVAQRVQWVILEGSLGRLQFSRWRSCYRHLDAGSLDSCLLTLGFFSLHSLAFLGPNIFHAMLYGCSELGSLLCFHVFFF